MQAVILAGGAGTRLRSVMNDRPKSMASFAAKPFLEYQVVSLRQQGFTEVVLCVGYMREHIERHFGDGQRWGLSITYSRESQPLGTGGAIRNARRLLRDSFLLLNGDSFLELDVRAFAEEHVRRRRRDPSAFGAVVLTRVDDATAYGSVELDYERRILCFREKMLTGAQWISAGIYVLEPEIFDAWPADRNLSLERQVLPNALASGRSLFGHLASGFFVDIGTPKGHETFRQYIEANGNGHSE